VENNPLISVLLPVYKHEAYLMEAVHSILSQTWTDFELLILSDDPDFDPKYYHGLDTRIQAYQCKYHRGKWNKINDGLDMANGQYIAFQDADDVSIPQRFELSLRHIGKSDFLYSDAISLNKDGTNSYLKPKNLADIYYEPLGNQGSYFIRNYNVPRFMEYINRGDDWVFVRKCLVNHKSFTYLPLPLYYYRDYTGNFRKNSNRIKRYFSNRKLKKIVNQIT